MCTTFETIRYILSRVQLVLRLKTTWVYSMSKWYQPVKLSLKSQFLKTSEAINELVQQVPFPVHRFVVALPCLAINFHAQNHSGLLQTSSRKPGANWNGLSKSLSGFWRFQVEDLKLKSHRVLSCCTLEGSVNLESPRRKGIFFLQVLCFLDDHWHLWANNQQRTFDSLCNEV